MLIEIVVLAVGALVVATCALTGLLAGLGRTSQPLAEATSGPRLAPSSAVLASPGLIDDLPLVAPGRAGFGTAGQLLVQAAQQRNGGPVDRRRTPFGDDAAGGSRAA